MPDEDGRQKAAGSAEGWRAAALLSGAGFTVAAAIAIGALGGMWLDHRFGTAPGFLVAGFLVGTIAGFMQMMRMVASAGGRK